jgi:hypothetical protein
MDAAAIHTHRPGEQTEPVARLVTAGTRSSGFLLAPNDTACFYR